MAATLNQYPQRDSLYNATSGGVAAFNRYQNRLVLHGREHDRSWLD